MGEYVPNAPAWVDDDGSGTTGTPFTADRMNHIEQGIRDTSRDTTWQPVVGSLGTNVNVAGSPGSSVMLDGGYVLNGALSGGGRVLLYGQTDPTQNGIWVYNYSGFSGASSWTRATDAATYDQMVQGRQVYVANGTYAEQRFTYVGGSNAAPGVDPLTFHPPVSVGRAFAFLMAA